MNANHNFLVNSLFRSQIGLQACLAFLLFAFLPAHSFSQWLPSGGTLSYTTTSSYAGHCEITTNSYHWTYTDASAVPHTFKQVSTDQTIGNQSQACQALALDPPTADIWSTDDFYEIEATGNSATLVGIGGVSDADYKVLSVLYTTPGDGSSNGYTNSQTYGTSSSIGSSFAVGSSVTYSVNFLSSDSAGVTFGSSVSAGSSSSFQESFTNANGIFLNSPHFSGNFQSEFDHNNDYILVWLNPEVVLHQTGNSTFDYSIRTPITNGASALVDDVQVSAYALQNNGGSTHVPAGALNMQYDAATHAQDLPGLAGICSSVRNNSTYASEYANLSCTLTDQCGCTSSDFAGILSADALVSSTPSSDLTTFSDPTSVDSSGTSACLFPSSTADNCRFVAVPSTFGGNVQKAALLDGPTYNGGSHTTNTFSQTHQTQTSQTFNSTQSYTVGTTLKVGSPIGPSLTTTSTLTWTEMQSTGISAGSSDALSISLSTDEPSCYGDVVLYEDTVFHTFVTQIQPGVTSCN